MHMYKKYEVVILEQKKKQGERKIRRWKIIVKKNVTHFLVVV